MIEYSNLSQTKTGRPRPMGLLPIWQRRAPREIFKRGCVTLSSIQQRVPFQRAHLISMFLTSDFKGFVGKSVTLPDRPVINDAQPGRMNAICISDPHATSFMVVAANKTNTTIHAFEYVKLQQAVDLATHVGELGSITGTLRKVEPNPNKSPTLVLRIYIGDATIAFSKALLGPPTVTVL